MPAGRWTDPQPVLYDDRSSTTTLLCITGEVRPHLHLHAHHTEHIAVLEGEATMLLSDSIFTIRPGTYVAIPVGTRHAVRVFGTAPLRVLSLRSLGDDGSDRVLVDPGAVWSDP
ncbi:MAG: cupin domain-containing protein [Flavobacteriales bacterium]